MNKTFTNSMALINQLNAEMDRNRESVSKDADTTETKNYGSIKRSHMINNIAKSTYIPSNNAKPSKSG